MPDQVDQDSPRLGEILRSLQDFRSEWRAAMEGLVRKDVYAADGRTFETRLEAANAENKRLAAELQTDRAQRQNLRTGLIVTGVAAFLSILGNIITVMVVG